MSYLVDPTEPDYLNDKAEDSFLSENETEDYNFKVDVRKFCVYTVCLVFVYYNYYVSYFITIFIKKKI